MLVNILALATLLSAVLVFSSTNPVISIISLIFVFVYAALYLILSGIIFIGISYIVIYIGAIVVIFLFIIMMLNIKQKDITELGKTYTKNIPLAIFIGSLLFYELSNILPFTFNNVFLLKLFTNLNFLFLNRTLPSDVFITYNPNYFDTIFINFAQIQQVGFSLYTSEAILLIILSIILLLAMLLPIFISKKYDTPFLGKQTNFNGNNHFPSNRINYSTSIKTFNLNPWWVTVFADAESSVIISIYKNNKMKLGWTVKAFFQVSLHVSDKELLFKLKEFFGCGTITQNSKVVSYKVWNLKDFIKFFLPHFEKLPMMTQKAADFILWKQIIEIISRKDHLTEKGLLQVLNIKASQNKGLSEDLKAKFKNIKPMVRPFINTNQILDSNWIAGFASGDGCFQIKVVSDETKIGQRVQLSFSLNQDVRDQNLLELIIKYLGAGKIYKNNRDQGVELRIFNFTEIQNIIIPFFK